MIDKFIKLRQIDRDVLGIVRAHVGVARAIKIRELLDLLGLADSPRNQRTIKQAVENLRMAGHYRVGSGRYAGLFWISGPEDWNAAYGPYKRQMQTMASMVSNAWKSCFPELAGQANLFDGDKAA